MPRLAALRRFANTGRHAEALEAEYPLKAAELLLSFADELITAHDL